MALSLYSSAFGQMQMKYWTTPPYKFNMFNASPAQSALSVNSDGPYRVANGAYDRDGNLLFYVQDYNVYSSAGIVVGELGGYNLANYDEAYDLLQSEISIVPIPGTCSQFYVIYAMDNLIGQCILLYNKVDCTGSTPVVTNWRDVAVQWPPNYILTTKHEGFLINFAGSMDHTTFAVSKIYIGSGATAKRFLLSTSFNGIYRSEINSNGITGATLIATDAQLGINNMSGYDGFEAELSWGSYRFAWVEQGYPSQNSKVHVIGITPSTGLWDNTVQHYTIAGAKGIEFNNSTTAYPLLYVSRTGGISKINTQTQAVTSVTLPAGIDLSNTFLEYGENMKIYGISPTYDLQGNLTATTYVGISSTDIITTANAGFDSRDLYNGNIFTLPDQVDGEDYYYFFGYPFVSISDFRLNGLQLNYYCGDWVNFFNCNSIIFNPVYSGGTPSQYLIEIKACSPGCSVITGNGYINYSSGWQNGQPATNLDLRTLTDPAGLNLGNITGTVKITYQIKNACGIIRSLAHSIIVSSAPQATIALNIYNKDNPQVYLAASHTISAPVAVGTASLGFRINNSAGLITYYTVKIDEVSSTGSFMQTIYNVTKNVSGVGGLTYENLNSYCVPASVWPANPGFGDCANTNPAYNGFTGYFSKGDGQYSFAHYYKLTVTIGNPCNSSQDYSYLYVNSRNKSMEVFGVPNSSNDTFENTLSVYPNPASEMVTFVINNTIEDNYTLTLNDMYGRVVKMLMNSQLLPAGMQTRSFNIADLSKGMYTYRLSSTSFTRKGLFAKQ